MEELQKQYDAFLKMNSFEPQCAEELALELAGVEGRELERKWLGGFIQVWDAHCVWEDLVSSL